MIDEASHAVDAESDRDTEPPPTPRDTIPCLPPTLPPPDTEDPCR